MIYISNRDFQKSLRSVRVHPHENSKQQDGKRRVVPAPLSAHPLVIWDAPLFGCLMSSSNHVARHTKHIVICEISRFEAYAGASVTA